jgi:hypothetical protein
VSHDANVEAVDDWPDADLVVTANENRNVGVDADLTEEARFLAGVVRVILRRVANSGLPLTGEPAVFFLQPNGPEGVNSLESYPMLDNGLTQIERRLWFVSPVVTAGKCLSLEAWDDAAVFGFACDELAVGATPAIVFEPRTTPAVARYYPLGLSQPEQYEQLRLSATAISLEDIFAVIDTIHERVLVTPNAQVPGPSLWAKARKHCPASKAEQLIQMHLRTGLTTAFPSCAVRPEQSQATGRLDLEIEETDWSDPTTVTRHAILELKVLRSFTSTGSAVPARQTRDAVADGVTQVSAYRKERAARSSALCCFDMRPEFTAEKCFTGTIKVRAGKLKVALRVWHLFASSKAYRELLTASGAGS